MYNSLVSFINAGPVSWLDYISYFFVKRTHNKVYEDVLLVISPKEPIDFPSLGVATLKSILASEGIKSTIIDLNMDFYEWARIKGLRNIDRYFYSDKKYSDFFESSLKEFLESSANLLIRNNPKVIAISSQSFLSVKPAEFLAEYIHENSDIKVLLGGAGFHHSKNKFVADTKQFINICRNSKSKTVKKHKNYPDYSGFDLRKYNKSRMKPFPTLPIIASYGCNSRCAYCDFHSYSSGFHVRDAGDVVDEIMYLKKKYKTFSFVFNDNAVNNDLDMLKEMCQRLIRYRSPVLWIAKAKFHEKMDSELIMMMSKAGCYNLSLGLESASPKVRRLMGKNCSVKSVSRQLKDFHRYGIDVLLFIMVGYPDESESDFDMTIRFILKHKRYINAVMLGTTCKIAEGSLLKKRFQDEEIKFSTPDDWVYGSNDPQTRVRRWFKARKILDQNGIRILDKNRQRVIKMRSKYIDKYK